ncbi:MAG TPA: tryptophan--tRNA ligase [Chloroflexota bacterium]|nr:tryptophan--tRNA ligase [Chloroflexota bacterium]
MIEAARTAGLKTAGKPVVFSGIQPSGYLTLGNYLGAIRNWVADQDRFANIFAIVDMHAISIPREPAELIESIQTLAAVYLAAGLDPARSEIFVQSDVDEHAVLSWILNSVTPVGWLNRMTQFKAKSAKERELTTAALYDYPVLMAADILIYGANYVPVGEDQKQHVELTRDIAERFNGLFGETFIVPKPMISDVGARIMSVVNPLDKMSKSEPEGAIGLLDPPEVIRRKIMRAQTDSFRDVVFDTARPGLFNLLIIYQLLSGAQREEIEARFEGKGYGELKRELAELVVDVLDPLRKRYDEIVSDRSYIVDVLRASADRLRPVAIDTVRLVKERVGLGVDRIG